MNTNNILAKSFAACAITFAIAAPACAQTASLTGAPPLTYNSMANGTNNNTILLVSGAVLLIGLVDDNSALTILGGVGVLYSVVGTGQNHYQFHDVARKGPFSIGFTTYGQLSPNTPRPSPYIEHTWKF